MSGLDDVTWADGHFASVVQDAKGAVLHFVDSLQREHVLRFDGCLWLEVGTAWADDVDRYSAFNEAAEIVRANAELIAAGGTARDDLVLIRFYGATMPHVPIVALIY